MKAEPIETGNVNDKKTKSKGRRRPDYKAKYTRILQECETATRFAKMFIEKTEQKDDQFLRGQIAAYEGLLKLAEEQ